MCPLSGDFNASAVVVVAGAYMGPEGVLEVPTQAAQTNVVIGDLPTSDPHQKGQLWNNGGAITISNG